MAKTVKPLPMPNLNQKLTLALLGESIRARRTQSNLRLDDAAALCGVAKQTLMNVEHGQDTSQISTILQICEGLGIQLCILPWSTEDEVSDEWQ